MANWEKYYHYEYVHGFLEQEPYYAHLLENCASFIENGIDPHLPLKVVLGGIHPHATLPSHFINLCRELFPTRSLLPIVVDQNRQAFDGIEEGGFTPVVEHLEDLPRATFENTSLLITDYTLDFMTNERVAKLNQSLPGLLQPNGLFVATIDDTLVPLFRRYQGLLEYGIPLHYRRPEKLKGLLNNLKLVILASTSNHNYLLIFARKDASATEFTGNAIALFKNEGPFENWLLKRKSS